MVIIGKIKKVEDVQRARHKTVEEVHSATPPKYRERVTRSHPPQRRKEHVRTGMDAPYTHARLYDGHDKEYKED
jgi:hypothetical protein